MTYSIICFYHSPCNDGSASAAALDYRLARANWLDRDFEIRFVPITHSGEWGDPFAQSLLDNELQPKHPVRAIFMVDIVISTTKFHQVIDHLSAEGLLGEVPLQVVCIDHHQTAIDRIDELRSFCTETYIKIGPGLSGATLVWEYFNERFGESLATPLLLRYVADQDIWEWKLPDSHEVNAALNVLGGTVDDMRDELHESFDDEPGWLERRRTEGRAIVTMVASQVARASRNVATFEIDGWVLLVVNSTCFKSELGNTLCQDHEASPNVVVMMYALQETFSVSCSLRSIAGGSVTARAIAEAYGGGGHDHAAGCRFASFDEMRNAIQDIAQRQWRAKEPHEE